MKKLNIRTGSFEEDSDVSFKKSISMQREIFKRSKLEKDYVTMCLVLENIKSEIKSKALQKGFKTDILRTEKIINWFNNIPSTYYTKTSSGSVSIFPEDKVKHNLTIGYELLIRVLDKLDLL